MVQILLPLLDVTCIDLKHITFYKVQVVVVESAHVYFLWVLIIVKNLKLVKKRSQSLDHRLSCNIGAPDDFLILLPHIFLINFLNHLRGLTMMVWVYFTPNMALGLMKRQVGTVLTDWGPLWG